MKVVLRSNQSMLIEIIIKIITQLTDASDSSQSKI